MSPRKKKSGKFKLKTHKATAKRFRKTKTGKILRTKGQQSHLRRKKAKRAKRLYSRMLKVKAKSHKKKIEQLAPYLGR